MIVRNLAVQSLFGTEVRAESALVQGTQVRPQNIRPARRGKTAKNIHLQGGFSQVSY